MRSGVCEACCHSHQSLTCLSLSWWTFISWWKLTCVQQLREKGETGTSSRAWEAWGRDAEGKLEHVFSFHAFLYFELPLFVYVHYAHVLLLKSLESSLTLLNPTAPNPHGFEEHPESTVGNKHSLCFSLWVPFDDSVTLLVESRKVLEVLRLAHLTTFSRTSQWAHADQKSKTLLILPLLPPILLMRIKLLFPKPFSWPKLFPSRPYTAGFQWFSGWCSSTCWLPSSPPSVWGRHGFSYYNDHAGSVRTVLIQMQQGLELLKAQFANCSVPPCEDDPRPDVAHALNLRRLRKVGGSLWVQA